MSQEKQNKAFVAEYLNAASGKEKTRATMEHYITDEDKTIF